MPQVTFIRHGESEYNANPDPKLINCDLTEKGREQCKELKFKFDLLILTPLKRSQRTYIHSNIKAKKIDIVDLFREYKQHPCDFLKGTEIIQETESELIDRVKQAITYLKQLKEKDIGIISHSNFIWYFMYVLTGKDDHKLLNNCDYIIINL